MPLVRIDVLHGYSPSEHKTIGDCVQRAMTETLDVPERDRFQIITEHAPETFDFNRTYLDVDRIDRFVLVHVTLSAGRSIEAKQAFYARLAELLTGRSHCAPRISPSSWSRTSAPTGPSVVGEASYVVIPREQSR